MWVGQTEGTMLTFFKMATVRKLPLVTIQVLLNMSIHPNSSLDKQTSIVLTLRTSVSVGQFSLHFNMPHHARWSECKLYSPFRINSTAVAFV